MNSVALPDYRRIEGNSGAWCLSRALGNTVEVIMLSFWADMDAIQQFAGADPVCARYYDFDDDDLLWRETCVRHFDMRAAG